MDADRRAQIRAELLEELDWPVTTGEVIGAAELQDEPAVAAAARRLPDDGHWLEIDTLWADLDPLLKDVVHG